MSLIPCIFDLLLKQYNKMSSFPIKCIEIPLLSLKLITVESSRKHERNFLLSAQTLRANIPCSHSPKIFLASPLRIEFKRCFKTRPKIF